jgi:hypothetical protein
MTLVEDHDVIQTLAANRTDDTLDESVLPRTAWRGDDFSDPHRIDSPAEFRAVRGVAIAQDIARRSTPGERFSYLTQQPPSGRVRRDIKSHNLPAIVGQNDHHVEQPKRRGCHNEQVDRSDTREVISHKATPGR